MKHGIIQNGINTTHTANDVVLARSFSYAFCAFSYDSFRSADSSPFNCDTITTLRFACSASVFILEFINYFAFNIQLFFSVHLEFFAETIAQKRENHSNVMTIKMSIKEHGF